MKYIPCGDGEYQLMVEEMMRNCLSSDIGHAINKELGRREPAIVFRQPIVDKNALKNRDVESSWGIAQASGKVEVLFLKITFKAEPGKDERTINTYIDEINPNVIDWFELLISTGGELALNDSIGDVAAIMVSGIPLDIPMMLVRK